MENRDHIEVHRDCDTAREEAMTSRLGQADWSSRQSDELIDSPDHPRLQTNQVLRFHARVTYITPRRVI